MKKLMSLLIIMVVFLSSTTTVFAATNKISNQKAVYDTEQFSEKSFSPQKIDNKNIISPFVAVLPGDGGGDYYYWTANLTKGGIATADSYIDSSKSYRAVIDHIYAKSRVYVNSSFVGSDSDSEYNSSRAGCSVSYSSNYWDKKEAYGNYSFEESGYQSWYPELYAN